MQLPVKAICYRRTKKNGTNPVNVQYCFSSERRIVLPTGIYIPLQFWNKKLQCILEKLPIEWGDAQQLNEQIFLLLRRVEDFIRLARRHNADVLELLKTYFSESTTSEELETILTTKDQNTQARYLNLDFFFQGRRLYNYANLKGVGIYASDISQYENAPTGI